ncbi:HpcH/HpaI aldolase/citrate lyase family protein [Actibacterium mucosum]|uniref:HpcH/HpaI aldolase/citrate lyase family protein n=1 Tax=Actibacterium mucosum TaxID=1087332 RepID=UPI0009DCC1C4|nr:CoA ester lyase [Actibacterium mucosum]
MRKYYPPVVPLFVPATRPDLIAKAARSGADAIIVDLEDAVPGAEKSSARLAIRTELAGHTVPVIVRVNAVDTPWFDEDLALVRDVQVDGIMLPKTQSPEDVSKVGEDIPVIGLIETARGVASLPSICCSPNLRQLAFGSIDYALDIGCVETRDALLLARLSLVNHSRAFDLPPPLDGITVSVDNEDIIRSDTKYAAQLGFSGKLAIHPKQVRIIDDALHPSEADIVWAELICAADRKSKGAAVLLDGRIIDAPVVKKAKRILQRAHTL